MELRVDRKKVEIILARKCMTSRELYKKAGITSTSYTKAVSTKNSRVDTIGKIARALGVDVTEILAD